MAILRMNWVLAISRSGFLLPYIQSSSSHVYALIWFLLIPTSMKRILRFSSCKLWLIIRNWISHINWISIPIRGKRIIYLVRVWIVVSIELIQLRIELISKFIGSNAILACLKWSEVFTTHWSCIISVFVHLVLSWCIKELWHC